MPYSVDPHTDPRGAVCAAAPALLDLDASHPHCVCGARITVEGGLDPRRLVPHQLSNRAVQHSFGRRQPCPQVPSLAAIGVLIDQWDHSALVVDWEGTPILVGPTHAEAVRTIGELSRSLNPAVRDWLFDQWRTHASARARAEEHALLRRRAARSARLRAGRQLITA